MIKQFIAQNLGGGQRICYIQLRPSNTAGNYGVRAIAVDDIMYPSSGNKINVTSDIKVEGYIEDGDGGSVFLMDDCIIKKGTSEIDTNNISRYPIIFTNAWKYCNLNPSSDSTYKYQFDTHN